MNSKNKKNLKLSKLKFKSIGKLNSCPAKGLNRPRENVS